MWPKFFLNWLNPRIFMPRQKYVKMPPFWFATEFNGARVEGPGPDVTSNREHDDSVVRFCGDGCESSSGSSKKLPARCIARGM